MKQSVLLLLLAFAFSSLLGQTLVFSENMGYPEGDVAIKNHVFQYSGVLTYKKEADIAEVRKSYASKDYANASGGGQVYLGAGGAFSINDIDAANFTALTLQFAYRKDNGTALPGLVLYFWNGTNWQSLPFAYNEAADAATGWYVISGVSLPSSAFINGLKLKWSNEGTVSVRIDDVKLSGAYPGGAINVTANLQNFGAEAGVPSAEQSYKVSGAGLSADVTITATAGFEVSLTSGSGFGSTVVIPQSATPGQTTVYVRMNSSSVGANYGRIAHTSSGAYTQQLMLQGNVLATAPYTPSNVTVSNITEHAAQINFLGGDGAGRLVILRAGSSVTSVPENATLYTANSFFGTGDELKAKEYAVFSGTGNSVVVTGLRSNTAYQIAVFEYNNEGKPSATHYAAAATGSFNTLSEPEGLQIAQLEQVYKIDFDNTLEYVNNAQFLGKGIAIVPDAGMLNSGAWAVTGLSDGDAGFGENKINGKFAKGFSTGKVTNGGIYAFEIAANNNTLGVQPGTGDFTPGSITLKLQNKTPNTIHTLGVAYRLYINNNEDRSSSFSFSYSADGQNFTAFAEASHTSVAGKDALGWQSNTFNLQLPGVNLLPNGNFYLRWSSDDAGGSGSRDEFGLDDISIAANPKGSIILPVNFTNLQVSKITGGIAVQWSNATEEAVSHYVIERAERNYRFEAIGQMPAQNNSGVKADYSFTDKAFTNQSVYYRIKCVELSGNIVYSNTVQIDFPGKAPQLAVYPNPAKGRQLVVHLNNYPVGRYQLCLYNAAAQLMYLETVVVKNLVEIINIPTANLKPGTYLLQCAGPVQLKQQIVVQ